MLQRTAVPPAPWRTTPGTSKESGLPVGPKLNHSYSWGFITNGNVWNSIEYILNSLFPIFFPFSPYVQCRTSKQMSWFKGCCVAGFGILVLKSLKCVGLRLLWLHALLRSCSSVASSHSIFSSPQWNHWSNLRMTAMQFPSSWNLHSIFLPARAIVIANVCHA